MAIVQWALFNQIDQYENIWFFGRYLLVRISHVLMRDLFRSKYHEFYSAQSIIFRISTDSVMAI